MSESGANTDVEVRQLESSDVPLFESLMSLFGEAFEEPDAYTGDRPSADYVAELLANENFVALVALDGSVVVGGLAAYDLPKFEQERSEMYIYDLAVAETHRRRGIATALIRHLQAIGKQRGAWVVFVQADVGDAPAIELYSKLGVREDVLHFDISIDE